MVGVVVQFVLHTACCMHLFARAGNSANVHLITLDLVCASSTHTRQAWSGVGFALQLVYVALFNLMVCVTCGASMVVCARGGSLCVRAPHVEIACLVVC